MEYKSICFRNKGSQKSTSKNLGKSWMEEMLEEKTDSQKDFMLNYLAAANEAQSVEKAMIKVVKIHLQSP